MHTNPTSQAAPRAWTDPFPEDLETEKRPWGRWTVLYSTPGIKVKLIEVHPGHRLSLQYHHHRSELWVCVAGQATARIGDSTQTMDLLSSVRIPVGTIHRLGNAGHTPAFIVEVQEGDRLVEEDIVRLEDDYQRALVTDKF
jgi:mannose-6-phosphate isomerase